jgi:hypothetical protein
MRPATLLLRAVLPIALLIGAATPALADTTGGGGPTDLGLDGIAVTSARVDAQTGVATVSGTISCSQDLSGVFVGVEIDQIVGRFHTLRGWGGAVADCLAADGVGTWTMSIQPDQGKYANGKATISGYAEIDFCDEYACYGDFVSVGPETIRLGR